MNVGDFERCWPILQDQVRGLRIPWLEQAAQQKQDPFRVLISCILSLRTQDKVTGEASERLFRIAGDAAKLSKVPAGRIEKAIYPVGFYRVKARQIRQISHRLSTEYKGKVPDSIDELLTFDGVGRKTANLVVTLGHRKPGICVDTHVHRITNRWGLVRTKNPVETEFSLRRVLPVKYWIPLNGTLVAFGQHVCKPISPVCSHCSISPYCEKTGVTKSR
ncbi:MAG: endonuclease III [Thermodesulfovibrionales bacterium]